MVMLSPTELTGTVVWLGAVDDSTKTIAAVSRNAVDLDWTGIAGDCHAGLTRAACVRVRSQYPKGTEIRNVRQLSVLSREDLDHVAQALGIPAVKPEWVGANMIVEGLPDFTLVPPSSRLVFENGAALTIDMENAPCRFPADLIEEAHPGHGRAFPKVAVNRRGVTAWTERPGRVEIGSRFRLHVPPQRLYPHL